MSIFPYAWSLALFLSLNFVELFKMQNPDGGFIFEEKNRLFVQEPSGEMSENDDGGKSVVVGMCVKTAVYDWIE